MAVEMRLIGVEYLTNSVGRLYAPCVWAWSARHRPGLSLIEPPMATLPGKSPSAVPLS